MGKFRLLIAVFGTIIFVCVLGFIIGLNSVIAHTPPSIDSGLLVSSAATAIAFIAIIVWGLPVHFFLKYKKINFIHWYALAGFLPGVIMVFVFNFYGKDPLYIQLLQALPMSIIGGVSASLFGYLANEKNT